MDAAFQELTWVDRAANRVFGALVTLGIGPSYAYMLEVKGRKSGRIYKTPVNLLQHDGKLWLVAPRGTTQWARNAEAVGEVTLRRGSQSTKYRARTIPPAERPAILKRYLEAYTGAVQRFFSVKAGSPLEAFRGVVDHHPVFELTRDA